MDELPEIDVNNPSESGVGEIRARCGFLCSTCQAYKGNIHGDSDRNHVHMTWNKIYGLEIPPEAIHCDGCLKPDDEKPSRIGGDCPIRCCVLEREIPHCGLCNDFPCELMEKHMISVETVYQECRNSCSPDELRDFIEPYLCRKFLESARE